jgi:hypothetical protein
VSYFRNDYIRKFLESINLYKNKILLTDVEDVRFQSDPFLINFEEGLYLSEECGTHTEWNLDGQRNCNSKLNIDIENKFPICNGTVLGTQKGIMNYLNFDKDNYSEDNGCLDQGLLNIYIRKFSKSHVCLPFEESLILTTAGLDMHKIKKVGANIINVNGEPYSIIHNNEGLPLF